jgi:hypothetical protein
MGHDDGREPGAGGEQPGQRGADRGPPLEADHGLADELEAGRLGDEDNGGRPERPQAGT